MSKNSEWIGIEQLADELGVPTRTVYAWRSKRTGPLGYKLGRRILFRRDEIEAWLQQHAEADKQPAA